MPTDSVASRLKKAAVKASRQLSGGHYMKAIGELNPVKSLCSAKECAKDAYKVLSLLGNTYRQLDELHEALPIYVEAHGLAVKRKDEYEAANFNGMVGYLMFQMYQDVLLADEIARENLALARKNGWLRVEANAAALLGTAYEGKVEYDCALWWYQQAHEIAVRAKYKKRIATTSSEIGKRLFFRRQFKEAEQMFSRALKLSRQCKNRMYIFDNLQWLADVHAINGDTQGALEFQRQIIDIAAKSGEPLDSYQAHMHLAQYNLTLYKYNLDPKNKSYKPEYLDEARAHYKEALDKVHTHAHTRRKVHCLLALSRLEFTAGNSDVSLTHAWNVFDIIKDKYEECLNLFQEMSECMVEAFRIERPVDASNLIANTARLREAISRRGSMYDCYDKSRIANLCLQIIEDLKHLRGDKEEEKEDFVFEPLRIRLNRNTRVFKREVKPGQVVTQVWNGRKVLFFDIIYEARPKIVPYGEMREKVLTPAARKTTTKKGSVASSLEKYKSEINRACGFKFIEGGKREGGFCFVFPKI